MTRKDYIAIARELDSRINGSPVMNRDEREGAIKVAYDLAGMFTVRYPNFNMDRFLDACGVNKSGYQEGDN